MVGVWLFAVVIDEVSQGGVHKSSEGFEEQFEVGILVLMGQRREQEQCEEREEWDRSVVDAQLCRSP